MRTACCLTGVYLWFCQPFGMVLNVFSSIYCICHLAAIRLLNTLFSTSQCTTNYMTMPRFNRKMKMVANERPAIVCQLRRFRRRKWEVRWGVRKAREKELIGHGPKSNAKNAESIFDCSAARLDGSGDDSNDVVDSTKWNHAYLFRPFGSFHHRWIRNVRSANVRMGFCETERTKKNR